MIKTEQPLVRIGFGYDVHRFTEGRPLILGGIEIPFELGLDGHSDADVLLHAVADAVLGALNLRDIGYHFPDTDPKYKGADSRLLLKEVTRMMHEKGYVVGNIDSTIVAEVPKINPYVEAMQQVMAELLDIHPQMVSIKATTNERMGAIGSKEGMAAYAVVVLMRQ